MGKGHYVHSRRRNDNLYNGDAMKRITDNEQLRAYKAKIYLEAVEPYATAIRMVREAVGELFGPVANLESEEAVLLRGPAPHHDAEAIIAALQRVKNKMERDKRYPGTKP